MLPLTRLSCRGLPGMLIYSDRGISRTPPLVNSKTPSQPSPAIVALLLGILRTTRSASDSLSWLMAVATRTWCIIPGRAEEELRVVSEEFEGEEAV